ncbi:MAG: helix-turn-helix transcriptional regulator [Phycisphaerae bacterium]
MPLTHSHSFSELKYALRHVAAALGHAWVAERAGVSRRAVSAWLRDDRVGSLAFAEKVARACGYAIVVTTVKTSDYGSRLRLMDPRRKPRRLRPLRQNLPPA